MVISQAEIRNNSEVARNIWRMEFYAPEIAREYRGPGQFITLSVINRKENLIRRPMSIAGAKDNIITIIYKIFGSVTQAFKTLNEGDYVEVLGPLGNTFNLEDMDYTPVLVGGGIGLAPILNLAEYFDNVGKRPVTIIGAKTAEEHFVKNYPKDNLYLSTDDGSAGTQGTVIDVLNRINNSVKNPFVYACGPEPMLKALKKYLIGLKVPGQFSVESYMACGFGFCQGCAISNGENYYLVCKDGPVFNYNEVSFD